MSLKDKLWSLKLKRATIEIDLKRAKQVNKPTEIQKKEVSDLEVRISMTDQEIRETESEYQKTLEEFEKEKSTIFALKNLRQDLEKYNLKLEGAKRKNDFMIMADLKNNTIPIIEEKIDELKKTIMINSDDVASVVSRWTDIPVTRLTLKDSDRLANMNERLSKKVFGQNEPIKELVNSIIQQRVGLSDPNRPISFLFLGPTGIGKTELAKSLAFELFDSENKLTVIDMSDYANEMSITKLIGAPAGYIGYEEGGTLTEPVKRKPFNVVLLDELDLAHQRVLNILYQLLDEGRVTDGKRAVVDFKNTVVIMTSNIGSEEILNSLNNQIDTKLIHDKLNSRFGSALANRIDKVLYFRSLDLSVLEHIFAYQLLLMNRRLSERNIELHVDEDVRKLVIEKSYSPIYGARPLKREVQRFMDGVTQLLMSGFEEGVIDVTLDDGVKVGEYCYRAGF